MSTWTSRAAALLTAAALAGCAAAGGGLRSRPVLGGAVTLAAPAGYCIDPGDVMEAGDSAVGLIGRCAGGNAAPAILTATVGGAGSGRGVAGSGEALAAFFASAEGRAALSRTGEARTVTVNEALAAGDAFLIRLTDTGAVPPEGWRAVLALRGRLVTLTVAGTPGAPLDAAAGRAILDRFLAAIRRANPATANPATAG